MGEREDFIAALREAADLFEQRPELPVPYSTTLDTFPQGSEAEQLVTMRRIASVLGTADKEFIGGYFCLSKKFPGNVAARFTVAREKVCRRIVLGTEEVPEKIIPAATRQIVEWECDEAILRPRTYSHPTAEAIAEGLADLAHRSEHGVVR